MYPILINIWMTIGVITFITLLIVSAPYGRHTRSGWGLTMPKRLGWILMESPALYLLWIYYFLYDGFSNPVLIFFLFIWSVHYFNRSFIWPMRIKKEGEMPVLVALMAFFFNAVNTFLHGYWFFLLDINYDISWFTEPVFIIGLLIFLLGMYINIHSDNILMRLAKESDGYKISNKGLYKYVSSPNYLGEILEWLGWAVLTWSVSGLVFFFWTVFNLLPRAISHHRWYKEKFEDYPKERKIIIPKIL